MLCNITNVTLIINFSNKENENKIQFFKINAIV